MPVVYFHLEIYVPVSRFSYRNFEVWSAIIAVRKSCAAWDPDVCSHFSPFGEKTLAPSQLSNYSILSVGKVNLPQGTVSIEIAICNAVAQVSGTCVR